jgi:hypothetical protein
MILFLVLIPTLIPTTLETMLKCKTKILYNCKSLSNNNTKTNSYKWTLSALDLLYRFLLLHQNNKVNMPGLTIIKAIIATIINLVKVVDNSKTYRQKLV